MGQSRCDCGLRRVCTCRGDGGRDGAGAVPPGVGDIRVDVAPLLASAGDSTATWVEQELPHEFAQALSGRLAPKGATLMVRVDSLTLGPNKDSRAWDNISGAATVGSVARPVGATSRYWASPIDQATIARSNHARVSAAPASFLLVSRKPVTEHYCAVH